MIANKTSTRLTCSVVVGPLEIREVASEMRSSGHHPRSSLSKSLESRSNSIVQVIELRIALLSVFCMTDHCSFLETCSAAIKQHRRRVSEKSENRWSVVF